MANAANLTFSASSTSIRRVGLTALSHGRYELTRSSSHGAVRRSSPSTIRVWAPTDASSSTALHRQRAFSKGSTGDARSRPRSAPACAASHWTAWLSLPVTTALAFPYARGSGVSKSVFEICLLPSGVWCAPPARGNVAPEVSVQTRHDVLRSYAQGLTPPAIRADEAGSQRPSERFDRFRTADTLTPGGQRTHVRADQAPVPSQDAVAAPGRAPGSQVTRSGAYLSTCPGRLPDARNRLQVDASGSSTWHLPRERPRPRQRFPEGRPDVLRAGGPGCTGSRRRPNINDHRSHQGETAA